MGDMKYSEYEDMYPETVIIRKEGVFYTVRGKGALVCRNFFSFKCWKTGDAIDSVSTGFVEANLTKVCNKLSEEAVSYIVIVHDEITAGESFDQNRFNEFSQGNISEIPDKEPRKMKGKKNEDILSDEEKKLCGISIKYMERLLNGRRPVDNSEIEKDSVIMDDNVQRCFSFVVNILNRVMYPEKSDETEKAVSRTKKEKKGIPTVATFKPDFEDVIDQMIQGNELRMSELEAIIKPYLGELFVEEIDKIPAARISNWLLDNGYLVSVPDNKGGTRREASENGKIIGMTNTLVQYDENNSYIQYKFTPKAQRFLFENLAEIAVFRRKKEKKN